MSSARFASLGSPGALAPAPPSAATPGAAGKRGRLAAMDAQPSGKQPRTGAAATMPAMAPFEMSVNAFGSSAADHLDKWPVGQPCWQIQLIHEAWPSFASFFVESFNAFLQRTAVEPADPKSIHELQNLYNLRVQITRPEGAAAPVKAWRPVVYAAGNGNALETVLSLLIDYAHHRSQWSGPRDLKPFPDASTQPFRVNLPMDAPQLMAPAFSFANVSINRGLPVRGWWQAAGPLGNKWLKLDVEVDEDGCVALGWSGQTYSLRDAFDDADVSLCEDGAGGFLRVLNGQRASISTSDDVEKLVKIIRDDLRGFPCLVFVEAIPEDKGDAGQSHHRVRAFVDKLQTLPHLHVQVAAV